MWQEAADERSRVAEIAQKMLSYFGFHVVLAESGTKSIELYRAEMATGAPFDFVILDLTVPGDIGGKDAIKKILQIDPKAKVIVSSGYSNDTVMANYKNYGFSGIIAKPFKLDNVHAVIYSILIDEQ